MRYSPRTEGPTGGRTLTCAKAPSNAALKVFHFPLAPPLSPSLRTSFRTSSPIDRPPNCTLTHTSTAETDTREGNTLLGTCCRIEGEGNWRLRLFTKTTTTVITPACGVALRVKAMRPMVAVGQQARWTPRRLHRLLRSISKRIFRTSTNSSDTTQFRGSDHPLRPAPPAYPNLPSAAARPQNFSREHQLPIL